MKLATKLVSILVVVMVAMLALEAFISAQHDVKAFEEDMRRDANQLGRTLRDLTEDVWKANGETRAMQLIEDANEVEPLVSARWVWLDERADDSFLPRVPFDKLAPVLRGESVTVQQREESAHVFLYTYVPLDLNGKRAAALELGKTLDGLDRFRRDTMVRVVLLAFGLVLGSALIVSILGVTLIGRPLSRLIEKTRRVGEGDLSSPLPLGGHDELAELATALNHMCGQLEGARNQILSEAEARIAALEQLRHADRLATVGRLAAGVAHELGTPMNVVSARAGMILDEEISADARESAHIIRKQIDKMAAIIRQLLDFARNRDPDKSEHNLQPLITDAADMLAALARKCKVDIDVISAAERHTARLDGGQFQQVVINLLENAIHASPDGGRVRVELSSTHGQPPDIHDSAAVPCIHLMIQDNGVGIDEEHLDHIFDPFFTTKDVGQGTGLGLSIVYGIVREHGGWIDVKSEPGKGTRFSIYLPKDEDPCLNES